MKLANRLSAIQVTNISAPGKIHDGNGLYLQVSSGGTKSWILRYMLDGKARHMGLGPFPLISLSDARKKSLGLKRHILEGVDPIALRESKRVERRLEAASQILFRDCASKYIEQHRTGWKNKKHAQQWVNTLETYAIPLLGRLPISAIETEHILKVLEPIWWEKSETANRVRNRIELVIDWATARGYRSGDNPARWRGHLDKLLPARSKVQKEQHHSALAIEDLGPFFRELDKHTGQSKDALLFLILTATRTNEVLKATWDEIDLENRLWIIPAERMKAGKEHRIPLSSWASDIIQKQRLQSEGTFIFSGIRKGKPLSSMSLLSVVRKTKFNITVHGFRSTFRDWAGEHTSYPREIIEQSLAHALKNKTEAAYRRGDLLGKRRLLMEDWSRTCHSALNAAGV